MAVNVSTLNILLTGSGEGLKAALNSAKEHAIDFGHSVNHSLEGVNGLIAGLGVGLSAGGFVEFIKGSFERLTQLGEAAASIGVTTSALSQLAYAAKFSGLGAEDLSGAMGKMSKSVADAAGGTGKAVAAFQTLGLTAKELQKLSPDEAFKKISTSFAGITNAAQRTQLEMDIFGKSGKALNATLSLGADGLNKAGAEALKLGVAISDIDAAKVEQAKTSFIKLQAAVEGVGNQLAVQLSPFISDAADRLFGLGTKGKGAADLVSGAMKFLSYGVAFVAEVLKGAEGVWHLFEAAGVGAAYLVVEAFRLLADGVAYVLRLLGTHPDTSGIDNMADDLAAKAAKLGAIGADQINDTIAGTEAAKVFEYFDAVKDKADKTAQAAAKLNAGAGAVVEEQANNAGKISKVFEELQKQIDGFGLSEGQKKALELKGLGASEADQDHAKSLADQLDKLKQQADITKDLIGMKKELGNFGLDDIGKKLNDLKDKGASDSQLAEAKQTLTAYEALKKAKEDGHKLDEEAKKIIEDSKTPLDKEREDIEKINEAYKTGRLTKEQYAKAIGKAQFELDEKTRAPAPKLIGANTQAGFELIAKIQGRANGGGNKVAEQHLDEAKKQTDLLTKIQEQEANNAPTGMATINV